MIRNVVFRSAAAVAVLLTPLLGQRPALGEPAPVMPLVDLDGKQRLLSELAGPRGLVVVFWAGWSDRSIEELTRLNANASDLVQHGVAVVAVNVDHQNPGPAELAIVRDRVMKLAITIPVLVDDGLKLFNAYGVISVPSTAVVNNKGELVRFSAGFAPGDREALFEALEELAGTARVVPTIQLPAVAPAALRRLQLGRMELASRRVAAAKATFEALIDSEPSFPDPVVELAAIALDEGDLSRADGLLNRAITLRQDHPAAARERARAVYIAGDATEAERLLHHLSATGTDPVVDAYLGFVCVGAGRATDAAAAFDRAKAAGGADPSGFLATAGDNRVATAMIAYRRGATRTMAPPK